MKDDYRIPFNRPTIVGKELYYISEAIHNGYSAGDAAFTKRCHAVFEETLGIPKALLTTSCTHALEMAAMLLGCDEGDEVIVPSFTFVSTPNAFALRGAKPVFADIRPDTLNIDETQIEALITERTKAIVPVHYAGIGCEMQTIIDIAERYNIAVVEDNAHGLYARYQDQYLGTFGEFATQSFHETKNFICGEGGALFINAEEYVERAEIVREKGTNRSRFFRGQVDKYTWVDIGSSYLPSDLLAAFLYAQLESRTEIFAKRQRVWDTYHRELQEWAIANDIKLPTVPTSCEQSYHMYYILLPSLVNRQSLIHHLAERGIQAVFHYLPLHLSDMGQHFGGQAGDCPITEDVSDRLLRLPFYNELSAVDQQFVIESLMEFEVEHVSALPVA